MRHPFGHPAFHAADPGATVLHGIARGARVMVILLAAFAACSEPQQEPGEGGAGQAGGASQPPGQADVSTDSAGRFEMTIGSGQFAGKHEAAGPMHCFSQDRIWGAGIQTGRERGLNEVSAMVQDVAQSGGRTERVEFSALFGEISDMSLESGLAGIGGAAGGGSGVATVEREGDGAVIRIEGTTSAGAPVTAVFRCSAVDRVD